MNEQPALELGVLVLDEADADLTIQQRFERFHANNPWVYNALESLAADWLAHGNKRVGMKQLFEVVRWSYGRQTVGSSFRMNNDHTSRYARLLVENHPEWAEAIELRRLRAA